MGPAALVRVVRGTSLLVNKAALEEEGEAVAEAENAAELEPTNLAEAEDAAKLERSNLESWARSCLVN